MWIRQRKRAWREERSPSFSGLLNAERESCRNRGRRVVSCGRLGLRNAANKGCDDEERKREIGICGVRRERNEPEKMMMRRSSTSESLESPKLIMTGVSGDRKN